MTVADFRKRIQRLDNLIIAGYIGMFFGTVGLVFTILEIIIIKLN